MTTVETTSSVVERVTIEGAALRGGLVGMVVGFFAVGAIAIAITLNAGSDLMPALGVGAFAAFWGGPGFGGMVGATLASIRADAAERDRERAAGS